MGEISEILTDPSHTDVKKGNDILELPNSQSEVQENCESDDFPKTEIEQHEEEQMESVEKPEIQVDQPKEVNVLEDIIQLIELVGSCVTKDGTNGKIKYKDGFLYLENLQTQFENIQEEVTEKDKMIVALVVENSTLKGEVYTSKEEFSKKCQQLEKLEQDYNKFKKEIDAKNLSEKIVIPTLPSEILKSKVDDLQQRFQQFKLKNERHGPLKNDLSSLQKNISLKAFQDDVELTLSRLELNLSLLAQCQKKIEEQLEYAQTSLEKLDNMCSETIQIQTVIESQSKMQSQLINNPVPSTSQSTAKNITLKSKSSIEFPLQSKSTSVSAFNSNSIDLPTLPQLKPLSVGPQYPNEKLHKSKQHTKSRADNIPKSVISRSPTNLPLRQQQQPILFGNSMGHHNTLLNQQYPNLFSQATDKCTICGMTFFNSAQLKLHGDLVHNYTTSGSAESPILSAMPYAAYTQSEMPNVSQMQRSQPNYHKHLWSSSQSTSSTKQKRMSTNPHQSSNQSESKRQCIDLFQNSSYPPVSITNSMVNLPYTAKNN